MKKELKMPKTKFEAIVFTAITAWMVVYVMNYINITVLVKTIKKVYFVEKKSWLLIWVIILLFLMVVKKKL